MAGIAGKKLPKRASNPPRPTTVRYWNSKRLQKRKIRNIMRHTGCETEYKAAMIQNKDRERSKQSEVSETDERQRSS